MKPCLGKRKNPIISQILDITVLAAGINFLHGILVLPLVCAVVARACVARLSPPKLLQWTGERESFQRLAAALCKLQEDFNKTIRLAGFIYCCGRRRKCACLGGAPALEVRAPSLSPEGKHHLETMEMMFGFFLSSIPFLADLALFHKNICISLHSCTKRKNKRKHLIRKRMIQ